MPEWSDVLRAANDDSVHLNVAYHADHTYKIICERIKEFEDSLDDAHEVGVKLASFGETVLMTVTDIGYSNPTTLVFHGLVNGKKATLIQHISQLNFLLLGLERQDPSKPKFQIGFSLSNDN